MKAIMSLKKGLFMKAIMSLKKVDYTYDITSGWNFR